jgi:transposase-like protein
MNARNFKEFLSELALLSRAQRERVLETLQSTGGNKTEGVIEAIATTRAACPHCASNALYRHGNSHGLQRYRCRVAGDRW